MKTLKFDIPEKKKSYRSYEYGTTDLNEVCSELNKNSLYEGLRQAYNYHVPVEISPDNVYNTICCIWAKYIFLNAEKFRKQIVEHEGQKELVYYTDNHDWTDENLKKHFDFFIEAINKDQKKSVIKWMQSDFSTTVPLDRLVRSSAILASQKAYYKYTSFLLCWFPEIRFLGETADWERLLGEVKNMPDFGDLGLQKWKAQLVEFVEKSLSGEEDVAYWQAAYTSSGGGSGMPRFYQGWTTIFNPINEKGDWLTKVNPESDMIDLTVDFKIELKNPAGVKYGDLKLTAGPTKVYCKDDVISFGNNFKHEVELVES